jgi:hypothetical protein
MKNSHVILMLLVVMSGFTHAKPFTPKDDGLVLERLPEQFFQSKTNTTIKRLRTQLNSNPQDWSSAR